MRRPYPSLMYDLAFDLFSLVRCWNPDCTGPARGRLFEQLFYTYCEFKRLTLTEAAGSRTLNGVSSASGFLHESDGVLATPELNIHLELKHLTQPVTKLDMVSFNQKGLDFIASESVKVRQRPLYRILVSGSKLRWEARVFAAQWGILTVEPQRLPLLTLHEFAKGQVPGISNSAVPEATEIAMEVPYFIVPVQERLRRIVSSLEVT
jgi:hypothetical protein